MAEIAVFQGRISEAETILLHNKNYDLVLEICLRLHRWERALEIAKNSPKSTHVDLVLSKRGKYLTALNCDEYVNSYLKMTNPKGGEEAEDQNGYGYWFKTLFRLENCPKTVDWIAKELWINGMTWLFDVSTNKYLNDLNIPKYIFF